MSRKITIALMALSALLLVFMGRSSQDSSNHTIRILIDRYPDRQSADATYRKIAPLIDEEHYQAIEDRPHDTFTLVPADSTRPTLVFSIIRDEITRSLLFAKGDADVLYDSLSLSRIGWLKRTYPSVRIFEKEDLTFSYLGYNFRNPILAKLEVRQAIAMSLPIHEWIHQKFFDWVVPFSPALPEDAHESEKLLDQAGYPRGKDGIRFSLRYFTTPVREGHELGSLVGEALKKLGIDLRLTTVETSLYYANLLHHEFDLISARWIRFDENELAAPHFETNGKFNYFGYSNPELDQKMHQEKSNFQSIYPAILKELPIYPLFNWKHGAILNARIQTPENFESKLDETFRFLAYLRLK